MGFQQYPLSPAKIRAVRADSTLHILIYFVIFIYIYFFLFLCFFFLIKSGKKTGGKYDMGSILLLSKET